MKTLTKAMVATVAAGAMAASAATPALAQQHRDVGVVERGGDLDHVDTDDR